MILKDFIKKLIALDVIWGTKAKKISGINDKDCTLSDTNVIWNNTNKTITFSNQSILPSWCKIGTYARIYDGNKIFVKDSLDSDYNNIAILTENTLTNSGVLFQIINVSGNVITIDITPTNRDSGSDLVTLDARIAIAINNSNIARINNLGCTVFNLQYQSTTGLGDGSGINLVNTDHFHKDKEYLTHEYNEFGHKMKVYDVENGIYTDLGATVFTDNNGNLIYK